MKPKLLLSLLTFSAGSLFAQEEIDTDRPDQTESATLVPQNYFQGEFGFNKENDKNGDYVLVHPASLLKYGLSNRIELRLEANYLTQYVHSYSGKVAETSIEPVELGTKISLTEEKALLPKTSLIVHVGFPFLASKRSRTTYWAPSFRFTMQNSLSENIGLGYNLGAEWDGENTTPTWTYTFSPGFNIGEKWYAYIEAFGFITNGSLPDHNVDGGLAYYFTKDLKADLSGGFGLSPNSLKNYAAIGFSFRIDCQHKR